MLPSGDVTWPPKSLAAEIARVRELAAWYGGDKAALLPASDAATKATMQRRWFGKGQLPTFGVPSGTSTGWGESEPMHVPIAADLARTSADLLFAEPPTFGVTVDALQVRVDELVDELALPAVLPEAAELCAALSGIYWRVGFDLSVTQDKPLLSWVQPDNALPEWSYGQLRAVTFVRQLEPPAGSRMIWRHLERHSVEVADGAFTPTAVIEHGLYAASEDEDKLGRQLPLTDHPETAGIAASLSADDSIRLPGVPRTAGYIPNMRPNRSGRGSPLGRPDIDQQLDLLRGVNETWTSWMRDLRLGKARIIAPLEYLRTGTPGQGATFDVDREVYQPLQMMPPAGTDPASAIKMAQFAIRTTEHADTLRMLVQQIVTGVGYSLWTFGMAEGAGPAATATEVTAREHLSLTTREKKTRYWSTGLREMWAALLALDHAMRFARSVPPGDERVRTEFARQVIEQPAQVAQTVNLLAQAEAASLQVKVQIVHPDWTQEQVDEEVGRIQAEMGRPAADPLAIGRPTPADLSTE